MKPVGIRQENDSRDVTLLTVGGETCWKGESVRPARDKYGIEAFFAGCRFYLLPLVYGIVYDLLDGRGLEVVVVGPPHYYGRAGYRVFVKEKEGTYGEVQQKKREGDMDMFDIPGERQVVRSRDALYLVNPGGHMTRLLSHLPRTLASLGLGELEIPQSATAEELLALTY